MNIDIIELGRSTRRHLGASLLSISVLALALLTLWVAQVQFVEPPSVVTLRMVGTAAPPPLEPPPPPQTSRAALKASVTVQVQGTGPTVYITKIEPQLDLGQPDRPILDDRQSKWQELAIDWNALTLNELDAMPTLLTPVRVKFPVSLSRRGVKQVLIKLDVVIDEQGLVTLVDIVSNPHPELTSEIHQLLRHSRFSAPQQDHQPVRARFIWPVAIEL